MFELLLKLARVDFQRYFVDRLDVRCDDPAFVSAVFLTVGKFLLRRRAVLRLFVIQRRVPSTSTAVHPGLGDIGLVVHGTECDVYRGGGGGIGMAEACQRGSYGRGVGLCAVIEDGECGRRLRPEGNRCGGLGEGDGDGAVVGDVVAVELSVANRLQSSTIGGADQMVSVAGPQ